MTLTSFPFILFFAIVFAINGLYAIGYKAGYFKGHQPYKVLLLLESYAFLVLLDLKTMICLIGLTIVCCIATEGIKKYRGQQGVAKGILAVALILILGQLCFFKYSGLIAELINDGLGWNCTTPFYYTILGISFFSFSAISLLVDTYRNKVSVNGLETALYLAFFPKFLSGPIARVGDFKAQLRCGIENLNWNNLQLGIQLVVLGMFKKMVLADHLAIFVDDVYLAPAAFSSFTCIWAMISYSLQIYFDFSGYSDMAIGFSRMLGIELKKNFDLPYISKNVTEFWKRWHISLSTWLQDYLYIPLGGNRKGAFRTKINLLITMTLGGLWHGASLTFVLWGVIHGCALILHKLFRERVQLAATKLITMVSILGTFIYATITWVFFRATDMQTAFSILGQAASMEGGISQPYSWTWIAIAFALWEVIFSYKKSKGESAITAKYPVLKLDTIRNLTIFFILVGLTVILAYVGNTAFIYGKF